MTRTSKFIFLFSLSLMLVFFIPSRTYASPGLGTAFNSRPTAYVAHAGVDDPTYAYDNNLATYARIAYDKSEYEEVKTFSTTGAPTTEAIAFVDFVMRYESAAGGSGENYRIIYYVGTAGPVVLQDWIGDGAAVPLSTRYWRAQAEPNDGVWSWADITNIRFRVEGVLGGGGAAYFYEHEAWVEVHSARIANMWVNPASQTDPSSPFSVKIDIATVDNLYGWEFKLYYNKTILTITTVTLQGILNYTVGGDLNKLWGTKTWTDAFNATHGRVYAAQSILGDIAGNTTNTGTIATLTFTVDGPGGTSGLNLSETKLVGYDFTNKRLAQMTHTRTHGSVTITGGVVPEFPFGAALEIGLIGAIAYVWLRSKRKQPPKLTKTSIQ